MTPRSGTRLLAIDPSSTRTGFAVFGHDDRLEEWSVLKPPSNRRFDERIRLMGEGAVSWVVNANPGVVVIEYGNKVHGKVAKRNASASGMGIYAMAVGAVMWACWSVKPGSIEMVDANDWTARYTAGGRRIQTQKDQRAAELALIYPCYDPAKDPGFDGADAIALGQWWLERRRCGG